MTYDAIGCILVFFQKLFGSGKGNLVYVFVDIFGSHANTAVAHGECACFLVNGYADAEFAQFAFELAERLQGFQLLCGVDGIADELAQKYFVITVEKLFYYGENILGSNPDCAFTHNMKICLLFCFYT